ncbi:MAG: carbonic anhydrase, partial [Methanomicrobiales archaeon HGW-Methanomicrobiales-4]
IEHLKTFPVVADRVKSGDVEVYGLYWNMTTGKVEVVV